MSENLIVTVAQGIQEKSRKLGKVCRLSSRPCRCPGRNRTERGGKTTLFNVIIGFVEPICGSCRFGEIELVGRRAHEIAAIGVRRTFQKVRLVAGLTVLQNLLLSTSLARTTALKCRVAARRTRRRWRDVRKRGIIRDPLGRRSDGLSRDTFRMVSRSCSLACCLASNQRVLLLDEPVSGLMWERRR